VHELDTGNDHPFGEELQRVHREAAGVLAAGIALMGLKRLDGDDLSLVVEDRGVDVVVGKVPAAVLRVVADQHVPGAPVVGLPVLEAVAHRER
jgi:hypothetical protein